MKRFELEDFFDKYEHVSGLINLASSDAQPWDGSSIADLLDPVLADFNLKYPDVKQSLLPGLERFCGLPPGIGVLPTSGAAEAIALVMHELASSPKRGAVAVPVPGYGAFIGLASLLGLKVYGYEYSPERNWAPDIDQLVELSKQGTTLIVNNPHNPSGHLISDADMRAIATAAGESGGTLIVDEVFRDDREGSSINLGSHVLTIGSLSKMYGLPGLRLGWITADAKRLVRLRTLQQYLTLTLGSFAVSLGSAVLNNLQRFRRTELIRENREILVRWAERSPAISISPPLGGTTVCLTVNSNISADALFKRFLEAKLLLAPGGQCFDFRPQLNWFRLGYGFDSDQLKRGLQRIGESL